MGKILKNRKSAAWWHREVWTSTATYLIIAIYITGLVGMLFFTESTVRMAPLGIVLALTFFGLVAKNAIACHSRDNRLKIKSTYYAMTLSLWLIYLVSVPASITVANKWIDSGTAGKFLEAVFSLVIIFLIEITVVNPREISSITKDGIELYNSEEAEIIENELDSITDRLNRTNSLLNRIEEFELVMGEHFKEKGTEATLNEYPKILEKRFKQFAINGEELSAVVMKWDEDNRDTQDFLSSLETIYRFSKGKAEKIKEAVDTMAVKFYIQDGLCSLICPVNTIFGWKTLCIIDSDEELDEDEGIMFLMILTSYERAVYHALVNHQYTELMEETVDEEEAL